MMSIPPSLLIWGVNEMKTMDEKRYKRRLEFQEKVIARQSDEIEELKLQIEKLKTECDLKDEIINSVGSLRTELKQHVSDVKKHKEEYVKLINELRKMKEIMNQEVYHGRWKLIRFLMK